MLVDNTKEIVNFERNGYIELPEKFPPKRRSFSLIESKRISSVSQIIANGPLPIDPTVNHAPQNSFDSNGYLLKEAWLDGSVPDIKPFSSNLSSGTSTQFRESKIKHEAPIFESSIARRRTSSSVTPAVLGYFWSELLESTIEEIILEILTDISKQQKIMKIADRVYQVYMNEFMRY